MANPAGLAQNTHICDEKRIRRRLAPDNSVFLGRREIRIVVSENAIFVEKKRVLRDASEEVPVSVSRDYRICGLDVCFTRRSGTLRLLAGASASAAADFPGLRPFRRGSLRLAQQCHTQRRPEGRRLHPRRHPENCVIGFIYRMRARNRICVFGV